MWIMHPRGFYSAVQHRDKPDTLLIRARCEADIRGLKDLLPDAEPFPLTNSDYEWRLECSVAEWMTAMARMTTEIDYPNFKNAIRSDKHHKAYLRCWSALLSIESPGRWKKQSWDFTPKHPQQRFGFPSQKKQKKQKRAAVEREARQLGIVGIRGYNLPELREAVRARGGRG